MPARSKLNSGTYENGQKIKGRFLICDGEIFPLKISLLNDGTNLFLF